ncbi:glycosyltransferase family 25 protein [Cyanobium gracile UHCC 0139]|uniref:Glycosyltransferase family 25 protein n=1 Tax=Cyanobium gracile UHCC 0139 TaxID=3110308 RepID=A0ABU5RWU9_9CYAN|nr:glycosyltransferase family 25 protein [Cyanobium gracile]MEA5392266.1 glycosyltransferase family 25 protein [Cyanobium gracile UHCC 0139]
MRLTTPIPVLAISLERSLDRRSRMQAQSSCFDCFDWCFVDAVDGRRLPKAAAMMLSKSAQWSEHQKGSIGCFLSHVMCWEKLEAECASHAIILEDDAIFPRLNDIFSIDLPSDFDLIFLNERMSLPILDESPVCYPSISGVIGHSQQDRFWGLVLMAT